MAFHRFVWTVFDFNMADPDVVLESQSFRAYYILDVEFRLLLTPRSDSDPTSLSLELQRRGNDHGPSKIKVGFELGVVDSQGVDRKMHVLQHEFGRNAKFGTGSFMARDKVMDFLQRGALTLYCIVHEDMSLDDEYVDFNYKEGSEELIVIEEKVADKADRRLESKLFPPGFFVQFWKVSDVLKAELIPIEKQKVHTEVFAEIVSGEKSLSSYCQRFHAEEETTLVLPDVKISDVKKDGFKLKVTVLDNAPRTTTKERKKKSGSPAHSVEYTKPDLYIKARGGSFYCSSIPLIAESPVLYHAVKEDDWLHFGLFGRVDAPPKVDKKVDMEVTRHPGHTTLVFPNLPKNALETVCSRSFWRLGRSLQMKKEDVEDVYQVAKALEMQLVGDTCVTEYLRTNMTTDSVLDWLKFGCSLSDEDHREIVTNTCLEHIHQYMAEILTSEEWRDILTKDKDLAELVLNYLEEVEGQREII